MPTRRTTLLGLGLLAAGGAGAAATGAFSAATAERQVNASFANNDTEALLAFQPTSDYARIDGGSNGQLVTNFQDLNRNANFTFEDTFIILNNGTDSVTLEGISSGDGDRQWRNENVDAPGSVLISNSVNNWQGTPNQEFIDENEVYPSVEGGNTEGGYIPARDLEGNSIELSPRTSTETGSPGDWISIGFRFGQDGGVGEWELEEIPTAVQFEFGQPE